MTLLDAFDLAACDDAELGRRAAAAMHTPGAS
jgi:hypothetical protein